MQLKDRFENMWVLKPTKALIKEMNIQSSWFMSNPGEFDDYVEAEIIGTTMYAQVKTDYIPRNVRVRQVDKNRLTTECECDMGHMLHGSYTCQHALVALQYLGDNFESMIHDVYTRRERVESILKTIPVEKALEFLAGVMAEDGDLYKYFIKKLELDDSKIDTDYDLELDRLYYMAMDENDRIAGNLDFGGYFSMAGENENAAKSIRLYRSISETISRNMHMVDDSGTYYTDCFVESIENMIEHVLKLPDKKDHIKYLTTMMTKAHPALLKHYRAALEAIAADEADLDHLHDLLAQAVEQTAPPENIAELTLLQVYVMEERDQKDKTLRILADRYRLSPAIRVKYIAHLMETDGRGAAKKEAMKMIREFPDDTPTIDAALGTLEKTEPEYGVLAMNLFMTTGDWKYYTIVRESPSWGAPRVIKYLKEKGSIHRATEACMREKMYDDAMQILESSRRLDLLSLHAKRLGKKYPTRYFDAYAPLIRKLVRQAGIGALTGRKQARLKRLSTKISKQIKGTQITQKHCEQIRKHLLAIRDVHDDRYPDLVDFVRSQHSKSILSEAIRDL